MSGSSDPYVYPGTKTLKNKLDIRNPGDLKDAQDERAAARYLLLEANLPKPPFTFETLKNIHRTLFSSVYDWAGEPRTITISKVDQFAHPALIPALSREAFGAIDNGQALMNLDRTAFAAKAANFLNAINLIHPFREGNGRSQRLLLTAMSEAAGHPISFDAVTEERMVATSIAAGHDNAASFTRLLEEITDPRRVAALRTALDAMKRFDVGGWNDTYLATTTAGQTYAGLFVGKAGNDFMMRVSAKPQDWIVVGDAADVPAQARSGQRVSITATQFSGPAPMPKAPADNALNVLMRGMRPSSNPGPPPGDPAPTSMAERLRAFEERAARTTGTSPAKPTQTSEPNQTSPPSKPRSGPGPG